MRWMVAGDQAPCDTAKWTLWGWESKWRHDKWSPKFSDTLLFILSLGSRPAGGGGAQLGGWLCLTRWRTSSFSQSLSRRSRSSRSGSVNIFFQCINKMFGGVKFRSIFFNFYPILHFNGNDINSTSTSVNSSTGTSRQDFNFSWKKVSNEKCGFLLTLPPIDWDLTCVKF